MKNKIAEKAVEILIVSFVLMAVSVLVIFVHFTKQKRYLYEQCSSNLFLTTIGIEMYFDEQGSLSNLDKYAEKACDNMPYQNGYQSEKCHDRAVKERIDGFCMNNTYGVKILGKHKYEIYAKPKRENSCTICYTEKDKTVINYKEKRCNKDYNCIH